MTERPIERWPSLKAVVRGSAVKVWWKMLQAARWSHIHMRPVVVDMMERITVARSSSLTLAAFSRARIDLRSAAESVTVKGSTDIKAKAAT